MDDMHGIPDGQKKEEKKKGFLGWLRSKLGIGGKNAMGGAGDGAAGLGGRGAAGMGRTALGAGRFGASAGGLGGLLGGNLGLIASFAVLSAMVAGFYYGSQSDSGNKAASAFNKNQSGTYVPAALRQKNNASSLDMFRDTNKGALAEPGAGEGGGYDKDGYDKDGYDKDGYNKEGYDRDGYDKDGYNKDGYNRDGYDRSGFDMNGATKDGGGQGQGVMSQLSSGLSKAFGSSSGGGEGGGGSGTRRDLQSGMNFGKVGSGFKNMSGFDQRKKLMAMKGSPRSVTGKASTKSATGKGALRQSKAIRNVQLSQRGSTDPAAMRATQDAAWTGTTDAGQAVGGTGLGGSGASGSGSGGDSSGSGSSGSGSSGSGSSGSSSGDGSSSGSSSSGTDPTPSPSPTPTDVSPWAGLAATILKLIVLSTILAIAGALIIKASGWTGVGLYIGMALCILAAAAAAAALVMATQLLSKYHQAALGALYMAGATLSLAAAVMAMVGSHTAATITMATWLAIAGGVCGLMGMMFK